MGRLSSKLRNMENNQIGYWCPGCNQMHGIQYGDTGDTWDWNGDVNSPTFSPSVLVTSGHYLPGRDPEQSCWCVFNANRPAEEKSFECRICHCFVRDGMIQFLPDSTHHLSGQTVPMPDLPDWMS